MCASDADRPRAADGEREDTLPRKVRVVVADDHLVVRDGIRFILEATADLELVGEAVDGAALLEVVPEKHPDVVLLDLRMPGMDGLNALEHLRRDWPDLAVVILTTYNEDDLMRRGLQAGARGYLLKDTTRETLLNTIRAASRGESILQPRTLARLLAAPQQVVGGEPLPLTERERQIMRAVAAGERSKEIAMHLGIAERTVKAHLASIYQKLGVDSRAAAVAETMRRGLLAHH
jgi:NarL family two-component system response regulator YdfI